MNNLHEQEFESELESEMAGELEGEHEQEQELESEGEGEFGEYEGQGENEQFLGGLLGSLLGEGEGENEGLGESEYETENELELEGLGELGEMGQLGEFEQEQFFGRIAKGIGRFVQRAAPVLKSVARIAAPMVGTAIGGPLGGMLGKAATQLLREQELENEFELEQETELELEHEQELAAPSSYQEAVAELMGEVAAAAQTEQEAEAMAGAATATIVSRSDSAALRRVLPHLVRGTAILTRILRGRRATRPAVRAIPTIVRSSVRTLRRRAARGLPVTRKTAAKVMAAHTKRVLGRPKLCAKAISNNVRAARVARRRAARPVNG